jgi:hypothetical protein
MTKFESNPELPTREFSVIVEVCVQAVGYREAAEQVRDILMSEACPQKVIVTDLEGPPFTNQVWIDLSE